MLSIGNAFCSKLSRILLSLVRHASGTEYASFGGINFKIIDVFKSCLVLVLIKYESVTVKNNKTGKGLRKIHL